MPKRPDNKSEFRLLVMLCISLYSFGAWLDFGLGTRGYVPVHQFQYGGRTAEVVRRDMRAHPDRYFIHFSAEDKVDSGLVTDDLGHRIEVNYRKYYLDGVRQY